MIRPASRLLVLVLLTASPAPSQAAFTFPDFGNLSGIVLNGSASQVGVTLQLTPNLSAQAGSAWYSMPVTVAGGFDTIISFRIVGQTTVSAADGMAFVIHYDAAGSGVLGSPGGSLGYLGSSVTFNSLAIELDTFANTDLADPAPNQISVHTNGKGLNSTHEGFSIGSATAAPVTLADGQMHTLRVEYLLPGTLNVYLDNIFGTPVLSLPYDFTNGGLLQSGNPVGGLALGPGGTAWVGFTAGTGGTTQASTLLSWDWTSNADPRLDFDITQPGGAGSIAFENRSATPGAVYFTALTFDPRNGTDPGGGFWFGLHMSLVDFLAQLRAGVAPFTGILDATGCSSFGVPGGTLPPGLPDIHGITTTFDPTLSSLLEVSDIASLTIL